MRIVVNDQVHLSEFRASDKDALIAHLNDRDIYDRTLRIPELYDHFRRQEMTTWERHRELAGEVARLRVQTLGKMAAAQVPTTQRCEPKEMLTIQEVADLLGCSYGEARKRLLEGRIKAVKDGRWLRTRREWVEEYVASKTISPPESAGADYEIAAPSSRRRSHVKVKTTGMGYRFLKDRPK
jgi:excisionase family DNA binding protein